MVEKGPARSGGQQETGLVTDAPSLQTSKSTGPMTPKVTSAALSAVQVTLGARIRSARRICGRVTAVAALVLVAAVPSTAAADPPSRATIVAGFEPITYGENAFVNGQLFGDNQGGQLVALEQSAPPFT